MRIVILSIASRSAFVDGAPCMQFSKPAASGQQQAASVPQTITVSSRATSETPVATLNQFCKAVRAMDWESEFLCYTESRRSRFTYFVIRGIDELAGEADLTEKSHCTRARVRNPQRGLHQLSIHALRKCVTLLCRFPIELDRRLTEWRDEIYPKVKNWPEFIKRLQPILVENHSRHTNDTTHPSQTGIVSHFNFHYFERAKNLTISNDQAEAIHSRCSSRSRLATCGRQRIFRSQHLVRRSNSRDLS